GVARGWADGIVRDSDWMNLCRRQTIIAPTLRVVAQFWTLRV
ncbi:hypothetical protein Pgy4_39525, partial [Pseudomonas savastanoi pv. glycinea str. race 4]